MGKKRAKPKKPKRPKPDNISLEKDPEAKAEGSQTEKEKDKVNVESRIAEDAEALLLEGHLQWKNLVGSGIGPGDFEDFIKQFLSGYEGVSSRSNSPKEEELRQYYGEPKEEAPSIEKISDHDKVVPKVTRTKK